MCNVLLSPGTKVQGYQKRELSDEFVPAQLWVITQAGDNSVYKIENANSRTIMDLTGSMSVSSLYQIVVSKIPPGSAGNPANGTPIIGYQSNGNPNQRWAILRSETDNDAYV